MQRRDDLLGNGYLAVLRTTFISDFGYRIETLARLARRLIAPIASVILWTIIYAASNTTTINGFPRADIFIYFFLVSAIGSVIPNANISNSMQYDIQSGNVATYLIKPFIYPLALIAETGGDALYEFTFITLPIFFVACATVGFNLVLLRVALFPIEILLGFLMTSLIYFMIGCLAAYVINISGISNTLLWVFNVLGGRLIPLTLFPAGIASVLTILPFASIYYLPVATISGLASWSYITNGILYMLGWIAVFFLASLLVWRVSKKKILAAGG